MLLFYNLVVIISCLLCVHAQNGLSEHYKFNHPPSIETLESEASPSPVAYKRGEAREEKSINLDQTDFEEESYPSKNNDEVVPVSIKDISHEEVEPEKEENKSEGHNSSNRNSIRPNLEIPVNVVYDTEPEVVYKENERSVNRSNKKRKQIIRRLQKSKSDESVKDVVSINDSKQESSTLSSTQNDPVNTPSPLSSGRGRKRMRTRPPVVPIVNEMNFVYAHSGNFHYSFEGGDGTKVFEEGSLKTINEDTGEAVHGGFSYTDKEGNDFSLSYTADENGYQPIGAHLPTPPPIPPAIARALAYLATKPVPHPTEATETFA